MRVAVSLLILCFVGESLTAYATNTNALYNSLGKCYNDVSSDIECVENVRDGLQKMSDYIQDIRDLRNNMKRVSDGMNTFNRVLGLAKYIPKVGIAVKIVQNTIKAARPAFDRAYNKVKAIDARIYRHKDKCDLGVEYCNRALTYMEIMKTRCGDGRSMVGSARTCVNKMVAGSLKTNLGNNMEQLGGALNPSFNETNQALGVVGSGCNEIARITNIALNWPDIGPIIDGIGDVYKTLKPILDFFNDLQNALNTRLCIPNPFEAIAEWEFAQEVAEALNPANWGWGRRRRSLPLTKLSSLTAAKTIAEKRAVIMVSRAQANDLLSMTKRGDLCLSAQDILDGVDAILGPLIDLANNIINKLMSVLPSFNLIGFPNFNNLFNININFNLPDISFGFDINDYVDFVYVNWNCAAQVGNVCRAVSGGVNVNCAASIEDYAPNWGWGRKRRSLTSRHADDQTQLIELIDLLRKRQQGQYYKRTQMDESHMISNMSSHMTYTTTMSPAAPPDELASTPEPTVIKVDIHPGPDTPRHDNKELYPEKAEEIVEHMTEEQKEKLREVMKCRASGGCHYAPGTARPTAAKPTTQSVASKREMYEKLLETLKYSLE